MNIVSMKVYRETEEGEHDKKWYKIKNAEEVLEMDLVSGDKMLIDGIGKLEIIGLFYDEKTGIKNAYRSLEITCIVI